MKIKQVFISAWSIVDPLYFCCTRLHYLESTKEQPAIFRVKLTRYKGHEIELEDGTYIKKNDLLVKIHLHNVRLLKELSFIDNDMKKTVVLLKKTKESLVDLAKYIRCHHSEEQIKGIMGVTMINKGYDKLGFEHFSISSQLYKWFKRLSHFPIYILSTTTRPKGWRKAPPPGYLFMSKATILKKYSIVE